MVIFLIDPERLCINPEPPHGENLARITGPQQKAIRIAPKAKTLRHLKN
jgi:hypothetical protein